MTAGSYGPTLDVRCSQCGAEPGQPCTYVYGDGTPEETPGAERTDLHFYRTRLPGGPMGTTSDRNDPRLTHGADDEPVEQAKVYLVLSEEERAKGFVRPVRTSYRHTTCGAVTTMAVGIAETYARNPHFYGATYCTACRMHKPVGPEGEFEWLDGSKVGS